METGLDDDNVFSEIEMQEIAAKREALRDVYGTSKVRSFSRDGEAMVAARNQLQDALESLEGDLKDAYMEAISIAPELVERESSLDRFLFARNYDPWAAARSIANYWVQRKSIFGERAYLPMDQTGKGALSPEVVRGMNACKSFMILPADTHRRPILFGDRTRMCSCCFQPKVRVQLFFYFLQLLLADDNALQNGFVGIVGINLVEGDSTKTKAAAKKSEGQFYKPALNIMTLVFSQAVPVKLNALHIVNLRSKSFMEGLLPSWLKMGERFQFAMPRVVVHFPHSRESVMSHLLPYGIFPEKIINDLGGTLDREAYFESWYQSVLNKELARYSKLPPSDSGAAGAEGSSPVSELLCFGAASSSSRTIFETQVSSASEELVTSSAYTTKELDDGAKSRKRKLDRMYQRNKREREKKLQRELYSQVNALQEENNALKAERSTLIMLHECANKIVENLSSNDKVDPTSRTHRSEAGATAVVPSARLQPSAALAAQRQDAIDNASLIENLVRTAGLQGARPTAAHHLMHDTMAGRAHALTNLPASSQPMYAGESQLPVGRTTGLSALSQMLGRVPGVSSVAPPPTLSNQQQQLVVDWQHHLHSAEQLRIREQITQHEISAILGARLPTFPASSVQFQSLFGGAPNPFLSSNAPRKTATSQEDRELLEALLSSTRRMNDSSLV